MLAFIKALSPTTWAIAGAGVIIICMGITIGFMSVNIDYKAAKIATLEEQKVTLNLTVERLTKENKSCSDKVDEQNTAVGELEVEGEELQAKLDKTASDNKSKQAKINELLSDIANTPVPKESQGAINDLYGFVKKFATDWNSK